MSFPKNLGTMYVVLIHMVPGNSATPDSPGAPAVSKIIANELIDEFLRVPQHERPDWNAHSRKRDDDFDENDEKEGEERREKLWSGSRGVQSPSTPLTSYTGQYWNTGYHTLTVEIKDDRLFEDANDRSEGFVLVFEHVRDHTKYIAHLTHYLEGGDEKLAAEFVFKDDKVVKLGIDFEPDLKDYIWFDKVETSTVTDQSREL